jgi:Josephin
MCTTIMKSMKIQHYYHERQQLALCAVHSVNNLLQNNDGQKKYTQRDFDQVCESLTSGCNSYWFNPHRSPLRIGNFDINVITYILENYEGMDVTWHDMRNELTLLDMMERKNLLGILWNVPVNTVMGRLLSQRHWIALLYHPSDEDTSNNNNVNNIQQQQQQSGTWMNLDSNLRSPEIIGTHTDCLRLLQSRKDSHILFVQRRS